MELFLILQVWCASLGSLVARFHGLHKFSTFQILHHFQSARVQVDGKVAIDTVFQDVLLQKMAPFLNERGPAVQLVFTGG